MEVQSVKQRFGLIGNTPSLNRALEVAVKVAPTDISVMVTGESGVGKETIPQIIHQYSNRKHHEYIAVNCGAIPEGTIDSELFGHEKGAFTGAQGARKGYFEVADGGTIFLDEVAELPLQTQVRLLRVLETGEFIKVGSSKVQKTDVRIIAATNEKMDAAIRKGKFREDLFYRLSTVPITLPPLRERRDDIHLLFRKFAADFAEKYRMPTIRLTEDAVHTLLAYRWPGNIRQLKNITEQISVIEQERTISKEILLKYLPFEDANNLPAVIDESAHSNGMDAAEKEMLYKLLFEMRNDISKLQQVVVELMEGNQDFSSSEKNAIIQKSQDTPGGTGGFMTPTKRQEFSYAQPSKEEYYYHDPIEEHVEVEESLSLEEREKELIIKALEKHNGKRKYAAKELGISERTLYRKIKEYDIKK
ncbi:sigma-54 interaction domain-containing protein [Parvicella tangerina]|uniref:Anaerobic nitric oxide reductase transcription regulator NorR n=1 Tax=Parvicella tangerina TaxID=2829795 RepID=A0A916JIZ0_9FLAO|nr:sigma-54 dependent transcriptional regulator [Parvicella tangerina]CAG5077199.1 Anaerobic nitric oxide reductase transcription regulator NorR [Parvicella tangerina]